MTSSCCYDFDEDSNHIKNRHKNFTSLVVKTEDYRKRYFSIREKLLILCTIFILIFCIVLLNLFMKERSQIWKRSEPVESKENSEIRDNRSTRHPDAIASQDFEVCSTPECLRSSSDILSAMDVSMDPCVDFYQYACGGWIRKNPIPAGRSSWSHFARLKIKVKKQLKRLLTLPETAKKYAKLKNEAVVKVIDYYKSCTNTAQIDKLGRIPLKTLLASYGSSSITSKSWNESSWDFTVAFVKIQKDQNALTPFLNIKVVRDLENSSKHVISIKNARSALTAGMMLQNDSSSIKIQNAYKGFMVNLSKLMGGNENFMFNTEEVFQFEKKIAEIIHRLPIVSTNEDCKLISVKQFCVQACKQIHWNDILRKLLQDSGYLIRETDQIRVCSLEYVRKISQLISRTPKRILANYMMWRVVQVHYRELSSTYETVFRNYMYSAFESTMQSGKREDHCLEKVKNLFGMALGRMYIDDSVKPESKTVVKKIVDDIRQSFRINVYNLDWMDNVTQRKTIEKVEALLAHVGYPDYILDDDSLNDKYMNVVIHKDKFFENQISYQQHFRREMFKKLGRPVNRSEWHFSPVVLNAYYDDTTNSMMLPASLFQPPFFHLGSSWAVNYGATGTFVAHELTHGFDDKGQRYDKHGNLARWWDNRTLQAFHNKTKCLKKQYDSYSFYGFKVKGASSLSENIADNGAIKQAYQAYKQWVAENGKEPILPRLNLSNDQLLFVSFAQTWCSSSTKQNAQANYYWSTYAPKPWRVKGPLRNFPEFSRAFNCPLGAPMNPQEKCAIW